MFYRNFIESFEEQEPYKAQLAKKLLDEAQYGITDCHCLFCMTGNPENCRKEC